MYYMYIWIILKYDKLFLFPYRFFAQLKNQNHEALDHMHRNGIFHRDVKPWPRFPSIGNTDMFG